MTTLNIPFNLNIIPSQVIVTSTNITSTAQWIEGAKTLSLQANWGTHAVGGSALTGSVDATVKLQVSNDNGSNYVDKSLMSLTLSGASGSSEIVSQAMANQWCRVVVTVNSVTGGSIEAWICVV